MVTQELSRPMSLLSRYSTASVLALVFVVALAAPARSQPFTYKDYFDSTLADNMSAINAGIACGGNCFYASQYYFNGILDMYEATGQLSYLDQAITWALSQVNYASLTSNVTNWDPPPPGSPTGRNLSGYKWWPGALNQCYVNNDPDGTGPLTCTLTTSFLDEVQGTREWARVIRIVRLNSELNVGSRATNINTIYNHLHTHFIVKWYVAVGINYHNLPLDDAISDKPIMLAHMLLELTRAGLGSTVISGGVTYNSYATNILENYAARISAPAGNGIAAAGAEIWDYQKNPTDSSTYSTDTSHANRMPSMVWAAKQAGRTEIPSTHLEKLGNLLSRIIWDLSLVNPRFTNYIDGVNDAYKTSAPWANGQIYSGWTRTATVSSEALAASKAMLECVIAGSSVCTSPSRTVHASLQGRINLSGTITLAEAATPPVPPLPGFTLSRSGATKLRLRH